MTGLTTKSSSNIQLNISQSRSTSIETSTLPAPTRLLSNENTLGISQTKQLRPVLQSAQTQSKLELNVKTIPISSGNVWQQSHKPSKSIQAGSITESQNGSQDDSSVTSTISSVMVGQYETGLIFDGARVNDSGRTGIPIALLPYQIQTNDVMSTRLSDEFPNMLSPALLETDMHPTITSNFKNPYDKNTNVTKVPQMSTKVVRSQSVESLEQADLDLNVIGLGFGLDNDDDQIYGPGYRTELTPSPLLPPSLPVPEIFLPMNIRGHSLSMPLPSANTTHSSNNNSNNILLHTNGQHSQSSPSIPYHRRPIQPMTQVSSQLSSLTSNTTSGLSQTYTSYEKPSTRTQSNTQNTVSSISSYSDTVGDVAGMVNEASVLSAEAPSFSPKIHPSHFPQYSPYYSNPISSSNSVSHQQQQNSLTELNIYQNPYTSPLIQSLTTPYDTPSGFNLSGSLLSGTSYGRDTNNLDSSTHSGNRSNSFSATTAHDYRPTNLSPPLTQYTTTGENAYIDRLASQLANKSNLPNPVGYSSIRGSSSDQLSSMATSHQSMIYNGNMSNQSSHGTILGMEGNLFLSCSCNFISSAHIRLVKVR
jgi:hypothetical protein